MGKLHLWQYNLTSGLWSIARDVTAETADEWLSIFNADGKGKFLYVVSARKPSPGRPPQSASTTN